MIAPTATAVRRAHRQVAITGIVEASTYLVLITTAVWRALLDGRHVAAVMGPVHGVTFLVYAGVVLFTRDDAGWSTRATITMLLASVVPGGGFAVARRVREGTLDT